MNGQNAAWKARSGSKVSDSLLVWIYILFVIVLCNFIVKLVNTNKDTRNKEWYVLQMLYSLQVSSLLLGIRFLKPNLPLVVSSNRPTLGTSDWYTHLATSRIYHLARPGYIGHTFLYVYISDHITRTGGSRSHRF